MSSQEKNGPAPKDAQVIVSMMKDLGIREYDPQVLSQLFALNYRYSTTILDDAKSFSSYAEKKNVDVEDVKIAIQMASHGLFFRPPTRDILISTAMDYNKSPLPTVRPRNGLQVPKDRYNFLHTNYKIRTDLYLDKTLKSVTKTTAAEMLEASKKIVHENSIISHYDSTVSKNSLNFDLQNITENQSVGQISVGENVKDEIVETDSFEDSSCLDIEIDGYFEKLPNYL